MMCSLTYYNNDSLVGAIREINPELAILVNKHGDQVLSDEYFTENLVIFRELQSNEKIALINAMIIKLSRAIDYEIEYLRNDTIRYISEVESNRDIVISESNNYMEIRKEEIWASVQKAGFERDITLAQIQALKEIEIRKIDASIAGYATLAEAAIEAIRFRGADSGSFKLDNGQSITFSIGRNK